MAAPLTTTQPALKRELRLRDLVLFNVSAIAGVRGLVFMARAGGGVATLCALAALLFFLPSALAVVRLAERYPEEGGMYIWTRHAAGEWHAFLCSWYYFLSNLFYFPSLLMAAVAIAAYIGGNPSALARHPALIMTVTLAALWAVSLLNVVGFNVGKWVSNAGAVCTMALPAMTVALAFAIGARHGSATRFTLLPEISFGTVKYWANIALAFTGLELAPIMAGEIINPRRNVRRAAWISAALCAAFYISGTVALLALSPAGKLDVVTGLADVAYNGGLLLHIPWLAPVFAACIVLAFTGSLGSYLAGCARLPFAIGLNRHLPAMFSALHPRWRTPYVSLLMQALVSTLLLILANSGETLQTGFELLIDLTNITTIIPFVYIFYAAFRAGARVPGLVGGVVSALGAVLALIPPAEAPFLRYEAKVAGGCILLTLVGRWLFAATRGAGDRVPPLAASPRD